MEDIGVLLTIESMIKEIYDKLKQLEYDDKREFSKDLEYILDQYKTPLLGGKKEEVVEE